MPIPLEIAYVLGAIVFIGAVLGVCGDIQKADIKRQKKAQKLAQANPVPACCCQNQDHHQGRHFGTVPLAPTHPLLPTVTPPSATTTIAHSMGIRLEAAPPVTIIDMPTSTLPVYQEFSKHPRPNVITTIPDSD